MVNNVRGFMLSLLITIILGMVPWKKTAIRRERPSSLKGGPVKKTKTMTGLGTENNTRRWLKGAVCGICFGIYPKATGLSPPSVIFLFLILVISLYSSHRKKPGNIFLTGMTTGVCLILYPVPSLLLFPLTLTLALTFYPVVSLPAGFFLVSLLISVFITRTIWDTILVLLIFLYNLGIDIYAGSSVAELGTVRKRCLERLVRRKIYRYCGLVFPLVIYPLYGLHVLRTVLISAAMTAILMEGARKFSPALNDLLRRLFTPVGKREEAFHISGTTTFLAGSAAASLFPGPIGPLAMVMLTLGDAWAVLAGSRWGRHPWQRGKSMEGSLACLFISFISAISLSLTITGFQSTWPSILIGSICLTVVEGSARGVWDNLLMAPAAAFAMWLLI